MRSKTIPGILFTSLILSSGFVSAENMLVSASQDSLVMPVARSSGDALVADSVVTENKITTSTVSAKELCTQIDRRLASVRPDDCIDNDLQKTSGVSVKGLPIILKEYPPVESRKPLGRVLLLGGIHGDELSSISIVFNWMRTLNKYHSGLFHWHVVPLLNPDGLLRKDPQRTNENGVDLNRNFPTANWHKESEHYWVTRTRKNPRRYPGPGPLSEPESQWLAEEIARFKPDAIVSVHAPYGILDFDGPRTAPKQLGHLHLNLLGTYPGSLGNYAGVQKEIPVVTIELPYAGIMPTEQQMSQIWVDLVRWLRKNVDSSASVMQVKTETQTDPS